MYILFDKKENHYFMNACCVTGQEEFAKKFDKIELAYDAILAFSYLGNFEVVEII